MKNENNTEKQLIEYCKKQHPAITVPKQPTHLLTQRLYHFIPAMKQHYNAEPFFITITF